MAGYTDIVEISYEQLSICDRSVSTQNLWGETLPNLVTQKGSILKGDIVNLLAINSQPLDRGMIASKDPQTIGKITITDGTVIIQHQD